MPKALDVRSSWVFSFFLSRSCFVAMSWLFSAGLIVIDLWLKHFIFSQPVPHQLPQQNNHRLFSIAQHFNYGITFDIPLPNDITIVITGAILIAVTIGYIRAIKRDDRPTALAFSLIFAGAIGNFFDRLTYGFVRDWLLIANHSVVNLADVSIAVGIFCWLWQQQRQNRKNKSKIVPDTEPGT